MKTRYKFIHFEMTYLKSVWTCFNNKSKAALGIVEYYKPWKQWVFSAEDQIDVFSISCLEDILDFMKQLSKEAINGKDS